MYFRDDISLPGIYRTNEMLNVMLNVLFVLCITSAVFSEFTDEESSVIIDINETNPGDSNISSAMSTSMYCEYPRDAFQILILSQCPVAHPSCIIDTPFDILVNLRYKCATGLLYLLVNSTCPEDAHCAVNVWTRPASAPWRTDPRVLSMNSSQLLAQISKDSELSDGHSNCLLTAFYAPDCVFSVRMVPYLYQLPRMYPRLRIVVIDATDHSKLNSRYGIIGTPTVLLWVDGSAVSRMEEAPFSLKAFRSYIEKWTDLELEHMPTVENENRSAEIIKFHESVFDWYFWASWCSFLISITYFFVNSKYGQAFWEIIRTNHNGADEV